MSSAQPQLKANLYKPASGSSRLASRISLRLGPSSTSGDRERSISNARASTGGRSAEVGLNVGSFTLDLEHDVGGEKESYGLRRVNKRQRGVEERTLPVGYIGKRSYLSKSFSRANFALSDIAACLAGSINSARWTGPGLMLHPSNHINFIGGGNENLLESTYNSPAATLKS